MSSLAATQSDGYYLPPEYYESGAYLKQTRNQFAAAASKNNNNNSINGTTDKKIKTGHNQWLKHGIVRFVLQEKCICLGTCQQSIGRGTRYNAKKITTDQLHLTTKIYEFQLKCRNCQHPWVIRTNPQEEGFDYVCGVKRQAGQEMNLITDPNASHSTNNTAVYTSKGNNNSNSSSNSKSSSLDKLESSVSEKMKKKTDIDELKQIRKLNDVSASVNDADTNATIRKSFRIERKGKRRRVQDATEKGWRDGMELLPSNDNDTIAANDTCYGRPNIDERHRLSFVRKSSIFSSPAVRTRISGSKRRQRKPQSEKRPDDIVSSNNTATRPDEVVSTLNTGSSGAEEKSVKKKTLQLRIGTSGLSVFEKEKKSSSSSVISIKEPTPSFLEMMTAYDSNSDSD